MLHIITLVKYLRSYTVGPRYNELIGGKGCPLLPKVRYIECILKTYINNELSMYGIY
jgi:hypothetical protein